MGALVHWSLANRATVLVLTLLLIAAGLQAARSLPIDAVPDVTSVQVQVITSSPALSPVEMEQFVSVPVERAMSGIPRVTEVRSISKYGISMVTVVFRDGTDIYFARQLVSERLREAEDDIPAAYGHPRMGPISTGLGEVFQFVLSGEGRTPMELHELLTWYVAPQLRMVPGVVEVNTIGGETRQYQVVVDPQRLQAVGVSIAEVVRALERSNANAGGGYIEKDREQIIIGTDGLVRTLEDLRSVVVGATADGAPITLATIGEVRFGPRLRHGGASQDGRGEAVVGVALMLMGENSRTVTNAIKAKLAAIAPSLPRGVRVEPFYDRSVLVDRTIATIARNLAEGAALVAIVLLVLLGDLRAGLVVAVTIPLAMLFAVICMHGLGLSGNLMSLGAIDFGLLVDAAVIIVENADRRLREVTGTAGRELSHEERMRVIGEAAIEVRRASVFGEAVIAVVYLPIFALEGVEGKMFHPMAATVLLALAGAFLVSITVVPALAGTLLSTGAHGSDPVLMRIAARIYRPLLDRSLAHRWLVVALGIGIVGFALHAAASLGAEFVPQLDEGDVLVEVRRLPGIALSESLATDDRIQKGLRTVPEVVRVVSKTGAPDIANDVMGVHETDTYLSLRPRTEWRPGLTKEGLSDEIARRLAAVVPDVAISISQPIQMRTNELVAGVQSDVGIQVFGPHLSTLQDIGARIGAAVRTVPGVADARVEETAGLRYLHLRPDRARLARYGLTIEDVNLVAETLSAGHPAGAVLEGDRRFDLVVRTNHPAGDLEAIRALPLKSASGQIVPLGDVADLESEIGPSEVSRAQQSRRLLVEFNVRGRDLVSTVEDVKRVVARDVTLPAEYHLEWGGQFRNYLVARRRLTYIVPVVLGLIAFLIWMALTDVRAAALILLNVPFAIVGGVLGLVLRHIPLSISAGVGFIALFGVSVLNGLVLLSTCLELEAAGEPPRAAIRSAALRRLRPVLMTALVASLGFLPMALSTDTGSEIQRPLATVVVGGVASAAALTLLLFPALYLTVKRAR